MYDILRTIEWFQATGQFGESPGPNKRWLAFYTGMQLEELSEKLELVPELSYFARHMKDLSLEFRKGHHDERLWTAFQANKKLFLDSDADVVWVTVGAAAASGAHFQQAYDMVTVANWNKRFPDGTFHLDSTGKVIKPADWVEADLSPFTAQE